MAFAGLCAPGAAEERLAPPAGTIMGASPGKSTAAPTPAPPALQSGHSNCMAACGSSRRKCSADTKEGASNCEAELFACANACSECLEPFAACVKDATADAVEGCNRQHVECFAAGYRERRKPARLVRFEGGDGLSEETAVKITGAADNMEGIQAEAFWIARAHPDWRKSHQHLVNKNFRIFDVIDYETPNGPRRVWFDIAGFFGKGFDR
jgi:hypothetical protein